MPGQVLDASCNVDGATDKGKFLQSMTPHQADDPGAAMQPDADFQRRLPLALEFAVVVFEG